MLNRRSVLLAVLAGGMAVLIVGFQASRAQEDAAVLTPAPDVPFDVDLSGLDDLEQKQRALNIFSWRTFIALSWPADPARNGQPDRSKKLGQGSPLVWETYKPDQEIFLNPPTPPTPFDARESLPDSCRRLGAEAGSKVLSMSSKFSPFLDADTQAFAGSTGFLIDQDGKRARYEILVNQDEFEFIVDNKLYDSRNQRGEIQFPSGRNPSAGQTGRVGAIEVKSAWKVLEAQNPLNSTFYQRQAYIFDPSPDNPDKGTCRGPVLMGLIGLHISHKTETAPQWIWSTFEHFSNAPGCIYPQRFGPCQVDYSLNSYSFAKQGCSLSDCPMNVLPTKATENDPVQVVRVAPIPEAVRQLNIAVQSLPEVRDTVWANYMLIDTQWPTAPNLPPIGNPNPRFLANSVIETYFQGTTPQTQSSSCLGCHFMARTASGNRSDFSFLLSHAYPREAK